MKSTKKRILLIDKSFDIGGIQTSLINLCSCIKDEYDIDLLMYYPHGKLENLIPREVNIIEASWMLQTFGMSLNTCMKKGDFKQKIFRVLCTIWTKVFDNRLPIYIAAKHQKINEKYDVAIAYHHEAGKKVLTSGFIRIMMRCVDADKKISWIHNDTGTYEIDEEFNDKYYGEVDEIVAVSQSIRDNFVKKHPTLKEKTTFCYNFLDYDGIKRKCNEKQDIQMPANKFICFSACRLTPIKGIVRAVNALSSIFTDNEDVVWYIAGDGEERASIEVEIDRLNLHNSIILLGNQSNPYSYMNNANLVMLLSYHEAAPMLYSEASYLGVPILTTKLSSTYEMIGGLDNVYICENSEDGIREKFNEIISKKDYVIKQRKCQEYDNQLMIENLERFNRIINSGNM